MKRLTVMALLLWLPSLGHATPAGPLEDSTRDGDLREMGRVRLLRQALKQAEKISGDWDPRQRDCAGFIRFLYRSSLTGTSRMWRGPDGELTDYVRAEDLVAYNFEPLGRNVSTEKLQTGDLLVYYSPFKAPADAWHLMVLLKPPAMAPDRLLVAYHNGERGPEGQVRKVWYDDLLDTTYSQWRPVPANPRFVGFFRWRGWKSLQGG